jgi:hypothetical protein
LTSVFVLYGLGVVDEAEAYRSTGLFVGLLKGEVEAPILFVSIEESAGENTGKEEIVEASSYIGVGIIEGDLAANAT